jgi:Protein of unknown function (DUF3108)
LQTSRRLLILIGCGLGLVVLLADVSAAAARSAAKFDAAYTATLWGIPIGRVSWTIEIDGDRFSAAASGETSGLARIFSYGHGVAASHGVTAEKRAVASDFDVSYALAESSDRIRILFRGGKAKEYLSHPPKPDPNRVPLTEAYRKNVVDPMTALLIRVPGEGTVLEPSACERKIHVFDGHMRYDLQLAFKQLEPVRAQAGYQGPALVCGVYFLPLAGYDPGRSSIKYLRAERNMKIWFAPLAGTRLLVPFRVAVPTPIGLGVLQATRFVSLPQPRSPARGAD